MCQPHKKLLGWTWKRMCNFKLQKVNLQIASSWDGIAGDSSRLHTGESLRGRKSLTNILLIIFKPEHRLQML